MIMRSSVRRLPAVLAAAALAVVCAACGSSTAGSTTSAPPGKASGSSFPVTVSAANGHVRVASRPDAIVSLSPTATEMLFAIGAGSQVKAVDSDSDYPPQAPHTKLSAYDPNVEAIAAYKPDLVVISNNMDSIEQQLNKLSIPVLLLPAAVHISDVYAQLDTLGRVTGHLAQAEAESASIRSQIARIVASAPHHTKPLTYYYEVGTNPYYSITSSTFIGNLLSLLGMKSIADSVHGAAAADGYPSLSAEFILKANPDYIILADTGSDGGQDATTVAKRPGWSVLTAVKDNHIIALNADIASRWGPRIVDLLRDVEAGVASGSR
jgi:iron complex transport system substrate-binding protein